ncbi:Uncharacterised protein, partial [Mycoplasma putrefaciens]
MKKNNKIAIVSFLILTFIMILSTLTFLVKYSNKETISNSNIQIDKKNFSDQNQDRW